MEYGYIFDFDGVLVRTMEAHFQCYKQALAEVGVPIDKKQFFFLAGMTGREHIKYFADKAGVKVDVDAVYQKKRQIWDAGGAPSAITAIECNLKWLRMLRANGVRVAIASGSSRPSILPAMNLHHIEVDAIVSAEDVSVGKPDPELFLRAAEWLGIKPENCIVVEDSDVGIASAKAAGMKSLRFYDNA